MDLLFRLRRWRNPHGETRLHLAPLIRRYGFDIGAESYGRPKIRFPGPGLNLTIGRFCSIADRVEIFLGGNHRSDWVTTYPFATLQGMWPSAPATTGVQVSRGDVVIGHDVWVGAGATILSGVRIGHGAVIGARAVVSRDVPPYAVVAGNPAALLRYRFDEPTIAALLDAAWWDLPRAQIEALIPDLQSPNAPRLLERARQFRAEAAPRLDARRG